MPIYMKLQVNYNELESIANLLSAEAQELEQMMARLAQGLNYLEGGAWEGQAANAFYADMREVVMPGMRTLTNRLEDVHSLMQQLNLHFQDAEQQAGNLFKQDGALKFGGTPFNMSSGGDMKFQADSFSFGDGSVHKWGDGSLKLDEANVLKLDSADKWHDPNIAAGGDIYKFGDGSLKLDYQKFGGGGGSGTNAFGGGGGSGDSGLKLHGSDVNITDGSSFKMSSGGDMKFGNANVTDGSSFKMSSGGDFKMSSGGDFKMSSGGDFKMSSGGDMKLSSGGDMKFDEGEFTGGV